MKTLLAFVAVLALAGGIAVPSQAKADSFSLHISDGHHGSRHYDRHDRHGWRDHHRPRHWGHYKWHHRPVIYTPPVVYAPPVRTVVYTQPSSIVADQASPTYYNRYGQLCRDYQTSGWGSAYGTACLQRDGAWRVVD